MQGRRPCFVQCLHKSKFHSPPTPSRLCEHDLLHLTRPRANSSPNYVRSSLAMPIYGMARFASVSSRLKLHHPLRPLLVKNPMSTFLTSNRITSLQGDLAIAVSAEVVDRRSFALDATCRGFATWDGDSSARGNYISFS